MDFKIILTECSPWRVEVPFETFVHARTLTLPLPFTPTPQKKCQVRIRCPFIEKYTPSPRKKKILCQKLLLPLTPPPTHTHTRPARPDHTHLPHTPLSWVTKWTYWHSPFVCKITFRVVLGWAYRGLTGGFLLLQNFSVAISVSPHVCFILVLILISMFLR